MKARKTCCVMILNSYPRLTTVYPFLPQQQQQKQNSHRITLIIATPEINIIIFIGLGLFNVALKFSHILLFEKI